MLSKRLKMDLKKVHQIVKEASGNNWALTNYTPIPDLTDGVPSNNKYRPGFTAAMMKKDLKLAIDAATSVNANTPLGKAALKIFSDFCGRVMQILIIQVYPKKLVLMLGIILLIQKAKTKL